MPAFGQVLFDVTERTQTQLPPDVRCIFFFDQKHLSQRLNFLLRLCRKRNNKNSLVTQEKTVTDAAKCAYFFCLFAIYCDVFWQTRAESPWKVQSVDSLSPLLLDLRASIHFLVSLRRSSLMMECHQNLQEEHGWKNTDQ